MTLQLPGVAPRTEVSWISPARGLWVATHRGEHAGMVERIEGVYYARNARGRELGQFDDLDAARAAVGTDPEPGVDARRLSTRRLANLLWAVNIAAATVAIGLAFALLR